jgi:hypothetical protein
MSRALVEVTDLARQHAPEAMAALVDIATRGKSESARVAAATVLLDRGYGCFSFLAARNVSPRASRSHM